MNKKTYTYLKIIFSIVIITLLIKFIHDNRAALEIFKEISGYYLIPIFLINITFIVLNSIFLVVIMKAFEKKIPLIRSIEITSLSNLTNMLTPFRGGAGIRAVYLKGKYKLNYTNFLSILLGTYVVVFLTGSIFGLLVLMIYFLSTVNPSIQAITLTIIFTVILFGMLTIIFVDLGRITNRLKNDDKTFFGRFINLIYKVIKGWQTLSKNRDTMTQIFLLTIFNFFVVVIMFYLEARSVGIEVDIKGSVLFSSLSSLSLLISLTPGSLGIKEAIVAFSESVIGVDASKLVLLTLYDRIIGIITIVGVYLFSYIAIKISGRKHISKMSKSNDKEGN